MARRMSEQYFGFEAEADILQEVAPPARFDRKRDQYVPYRDAMRLAAANQPEGWNPEDPPMKPTPFPNELHFAVQEEVQNRFGDETNVQLYTASGSALDKLHGVDTFILIQSGEKKAVVTIDVTLNEEKAARGHKADVIILLPQDFIDLSSKHREVHEAGWAKEILQKLEEQDFATV